MGNPSELDDCILLFFLEQEFRRGSVEADDWGRREIKSLIKKFGGKL